MDDYFAISSDEDGVIIERLDKATLLKRFNENYYGSRRPFIRLTTGADLSSVYGLLVIKGKDVLPKEKNVVKEYDIE